MKDMDEIDAETVVTILVPFFNEGEGVSQFYDHVTRVINGIRTCRFEVVCIDDGSSDDTLDRLIQLSDLDSRFRIVELSRNFGKEAALTAGLEHAEGEAVIPIDADLQDPPELIPVLIEAWLDGAEVVLAKRRSRDADTYLKRTTASLFYKFHNMLSRPKIPNNVGDFRLMDRVVVDALRRLPERQRFMKGLFAWVGFKSRIVEYDRPPRSVGDTKLSFWKLWNLAIDGVTSFSTVPLRIWTYIGGGCAMMTFAYIFIIVTRTLMFGVDVPGYASLLVVVLFFGSLQLVSIGLLGEYIGRIYSETKQRPVYIVRRLYGGSNRTGSKRRASDSRRAHRCR